MAGNISDYLENKLLDHTLAKTDFDKPAACYVGLFTGSPADDYSGSASEVATGTTTSYARKSATFSAAAGGSTTNSADVLFDEATASWGNLTHAALFTSSDGSGSANMLWHGSLAANKSIASGDQFKIKAGDLDVSLD